MPHKSTSVICDGRGGIFPCNPSRVTVWKSSVAAVSRAKRPGMGLPSKFPTQTHRTQSPITPQNDTATTEIYTLSYRRLPISVVAVSLDRKSTRLNSSHTLISYPVFCFKKQKSDRKSTRLHSSLTLISYSGYCF